VLRHALETFTIADIRRTGPGVSDDTIRIVLGELKDAVGSPTQGTGRGATWRRSTGAVG